MSFIELCADPITFCVDWKNREITVLNSNKREIEITNTGSFDNISTFSISFEENKEPYSNFILGRKKQFIYDFWPITEGCCRKERMSFLLNALTATTKDVEQCIAICSIKLEHNTRNINDFLSRIPNFITNLKSDSNHETLGRHYQYILDNNLNYTHESLCKMSEEDIRSISTQLCHKIEVDEHIKLFDKKVEIEKIRLYREEREKVWRKNIENSDEMWDQVNKIIDADKEKEETDKLIIEMEEENGVIIHQASKPSDSTKHIAFYRGRATQLISDLYPNIAKDCNRAIKIKELLPSLTKDDHTINANVEITISKLKLPTRNQLELLDLYPYDILSDMTDEDKYEYGRNYQFLLDTDRRKYDQASLLTTPSYYVKLNADKLREKLANKFEKPDYFHVRNIECKGSKCRMHARDGNGIHCISCYGSDYEDD